MLRNVRKGVPNHYKRVKRGAIRPLRSGGSLSAYYDHLPVIFVPILLFFFSFFFVMFWSIYEIQQQVS